MRLVYRMALPRGWMRLNGRLVLNVSEALPRGWMRLDCHLVLYEFFRIWNGTRLVIKRLSLYYQIFWVRVKPNIVWLNFGLAIPELDFIWLIDVGFCVHVYIYYYELIWALFVFIFEYNLWLQVQERNVANLSHWEFISHPLFGLSFQVPGQQIRERHEVGRPGYSAA